MSSYSIRFALKNDLPEIIRLCRDHASYEKSGYDEKGKIFSLEQHIFAERPSLYCLVVEREKKLIGYATYMPQFSTWDAVFYYYMDCLYLDASARSQGIGAALIDRIAEEGRKNKIDLIQWQTPEFNEGAIRFYKRIGATSLSKERFFLKLNP